ncbi:MAG: Galactokinase [Oscillospiraceae bacterium]|nr:Galactokinase [Oscillospiraceae bacterium]
MKDCNSLIEYINSGNMDQDFDGLYGASNIEYQRNRYVNAVKGFINTFGDFKNPLLYSAPGRTEIGGNHTDHNHGRVLTASVNLDVIAVVVPNDTNLIRIKSEGFEMDVVDISYLIKDVEEVNKSASLIRGTAANFKDFGYHIGGFDAYTTSNVLKGSGLSSSAAFEVLVGTILNHEYNSGKVSSVEIAQIAQFAENVFFGKPCGLMDQMASSVGGIITIDFEDTNNPDIEKIDFDFQQTGCALCIVDVGGDHADLTHEYAAIPSEMREVAKMLGEKYLRKTSYEDVIKNLGEIRRHLGDRAALRAMHFLRENERVVDMVNALKSDDFETFKKLIIESGDSSYKYLQNVYCSYNVMSQPMSIALCVAQGILEGKGAWRVHGGGFGGTIQNFVPFELLDEFKQTIESIFGKGSCHVLSIRQDGGVKLSIGECE